VVEAEADDNERIAALDQPINLTGAQALPELHLDVHVYGTKPADRFVYINMRKYHEGNNPAEGPVLERIRRAGVVLNYPGSAFRVAAGNHNLTPFPPGAAAHRPSCDS